MKRISTVALGLALAATARAEIIEVSLPDLLGEYSGETGTTRTTNVILPMQPAVINGVSLRIAGTSVLGQVVCHIHEPVVENWPLEFGARFNADTGAWLASPRVPFDQSGAFTSTDEFSAYPTTGTTWDFLLDGAAELRLSGSPAALVGLCYEELSLPSAVLDTATLIIDAEFTVPVVASTWGKIKALYR